jgi:aromatic amino acid aminotransferase I
MAPPSAIDIEAVRDTEGIPFPDPLTVNGVAGRRLKAGKLVAGTAAYTSSDFFKSPVSSPPHSKDHLLTILGFRKAQSQTMGS